MAGSPCTSYYYFNGKRVAMRTGMPVTYLHGDMLGSASLTMGDASTTTAKSELRYTPFGRIRLQSSWTETDRRFTGQQEEEGIELYDYGARFYSPLLGRFVSPDSVLSNAKNPQAWNRYSYANNQPLRLVDPSGHVPIPPETVSLPEQYGQIIHAIIELDFAATVAPSQSYGGELSEITKFKPFQVPGLGGSNGVGSPDIYYSPGGLYDFSSGKEKQIYEIKSTQDVDFPSKNSLRDGKDSLRQAITACNGSGVGPCVPGTYYPPTVGETDRRVIPLVPGVANIVARLVAPGVIVYNIQPDPKALIAVTTEVVSDYIKKWRDKIKRQPKPPPLPPSPVPAYRPT